MKRAFWQITLSSALTLAAYIALYAIWGAILNEFESETVQLLLVALMTTAAYGAILLWISKIRRSVGENEVIVDYRERTYTTVWDDLRLILRREAKVLILMAVLVLCCFALNRIDILIFEKKTFSHVTFLYAAMSLFGPLFRVQLIGVLLSAVLNPAAYLFFLLLYRKKKYTYWMKQR